MLNSDLNIEKLKEAIIDKFKLIEPTQKTFIRYEIGEFFIEYTDGVMNSNFPNDFYDEWNKLKDLSQKQLKEKGHFPLIKSLFEAAALKIHTPLYIPVERTFTATFSNFLASFQRYKIPIADFILQFLESFSFARDGVKMMDLPFLNATYRFKNGIDVIEHKDQDKTSISLDIASSGFQAIVPLLLIFEYFSKEKDPFSYFFAVEEPELNLFPSIQKEVVEQIIPKAINNNCRLILATHSPYILTVLNNLMAAKTIIKEKPETNLEVNKLIPSQYHVDYENVIAYYVGNGTAKPIMNEEYSMIDANAIDDVSDNLGHIFSQLLDLKYPN